MPNAELNRQIENLIRIGTVFAIDHGARRVRVKSGGVDTNWLKWRVGRAGATRTWDPPTIGEQVMILSPSGVLDNGIVMPSIFSDEFDAPSDNPDEHVVDYPDGARITYNHESGALSATGIKTAAVVASDEIRLEAKKIHIYASERYVFECNGHGQEWLHDRVNTWQIGEVAGTSHPISPPEIA
jgi:phage baseplate assembly protein V